MGTSPIIRQELSSDTRMKILEVGEKLFSEYGFDGTSLRKITREAGVNLASVNYHFKSKENLFYELLVARVRPINQARMALLDRFEKEARDGVVSVEQILESFMMPPFELAKDPNRQTFLRLFGRIMHESSGFYEVLFEKEFSPLAKRYFVAMKKAFPERDDEAIFWSLQFSAAVLVHLVSHYQRLKRMSGGLCDPSDSDKVLERAIRFTAAGIRTGIS